MKEEVRGFTWDFWITFWIFFQIHLRKLKFFARISSSFGYLKIVGYWKLCVWKGQILIIRYNISCKIMESSICTSGIETVPSLLIILRLRFTSLRKFMLLYYFFSFFLSEWRVSDLENLFLVTLRRRRIELEAGFITVFIVGSHHLRLRPASCLYISRVGVRILVYSSFNCAWKRRRRKNVMQ